MNAENQQKLQTLLAASTVVTPTVENAISEVRRTVATGDEPVLWSESLMNLSVALARAHEWEKAQAVASSINDIVPDFYARYDEALAHHNIAIELRKANGASSRHQILAMLEVAVMKATTQDTGLEWQRGELLIRVAKMFFDEGETTKAEQAWNQAIAVARTGEQNGDKVESASVLWEIATTLAECGCIAQAREVAAKIVGSEGKRQRALASVEQIAQGMSKEE